MPIGQLATLLAPVFATVLAGWAAARFTGLPPRASSLLQRLTFDAIVPLLLFHTLATAAPSGPFDAALLLAYYLPTLALYAAVLAGACHCGHTLREANVLALASTYGNAVLLGVPLVLRTFGDAAAVPLFAIVGLHSVLMFFLTTLVHELAGDALQLRDLLRNTASRLLRNPILVGICAGALVQPLGIVLPAPVLALGEGVAVIAPWAALVAMGLGLASHDLRGAATGAARVVLCKQVLHPLLVLAGAALLLGVSAPATAVLVTIAALPTGINVYLFAVRFGAAENTSASAIVAGTALSCLGIAAVLALLGVPG